MRYLTIGFTFFILCGSLFAATVMVDTVSAEPKEMWDQLEVQSVRAMENGLIDACFEKGWMVFNVSTVESVMNTPTNDALLQAKKVGAEYLLRLQAQSEDRKMIYILYSVSGEVVISSGEWFMDDITEETDKELTDLYYLAGQKILDTLISRN